MARVRRTAGERSLGHAGTLDPAATGLLVLMLGKATRLAPWLTGHTKTYDADIRFGFGTTTDDAQGTPLTDGPEGPIPTEAAIGAALDATVGSFDQMPPQFSAKRIDGRHAYALARREQPVALTASRVTLLAWAWLGLRGDTARVRVTTSAGFYVRALARDLGRGLGCGAHLSALRRTASGPFLVDRALPLGEAELAGADIARRLIPMAEAVPELAAVRVSEAGLIRVRHGNAIGPQLVEGTWVPPQAPPGKIRLVDGSGALVALADVRDGQLHPTVVLV